MAQHTLDLFAQSSAPEPDAPAGTSWTAVRDALDTDGVALTDPLLSAEECAEALSWWDEPARFRSTVVMQRHGFGRGTYRYLADPLPGLVQRLRERLYPPLAGIANDWAPLLKERRFPLAHRDLATECAEAGQYKPTPLLLRYGPGDHATLHQDLYGDIVFPLQAAIMLNQPDRDFTGGESVFVEQRPRSQSRVLVLRPQRGHGLVFPVRHRPVLGAHGYRRHAMRHGTGTVHTGTRTVLGIIFHNAR
ncbi:2OG-Fe(II) oxygenase [Amycolatopsis alba]|uniref:Proline hydroxylase n=1 Tax=Amycolatopsis alba DSM 44262 TaxID=1125972 RepID=A0A229RB19_AMYAL|nr:2OG-Fe(II) oxygenase [Amycolatopsis alba]OXM43847.1 proline hydroxylase [Amycolatopsis alba DSM 44262]